MKTPHWKHLFLIGAMAVPSLAARAEESPQAQIEAMRRQLHQQQRVIEQQQQRLSSLEHQEEQNWLNERRAEEVKALVREVLADAETRASLLDDGLTAGYKNGFIIASPDGNFELRTNVEGQVRYIYNHADQDPGVDQDENGFQIRRARLDFRGHAIDPRLTYRLRIDADRATGSIFLEYAYFGYEFAEGWNLQVGQFKPLFLREENVSSFRQLAVERSYAADYFTIDYSQGAELTYDGGWWRPSLSLHDGSYAVNSEFTADRSNLGIAGRTEFLLAGDWKQFDDFTSWADDKFGLLLGAAIDYEQGEEGSGTDTPDIAKFSLDASAELGGFNLFAALYGQQLDDDGSGTAGGLPSKLDGANQFGFVVQGGAFVIPDKLEPFARFEWIDFDGVYYRNSGAGTQGGTGDLSDEDQLSIVTVGANYYFKKHNAKLTFDVQYALDPVPVGNSGAGLVGSPDDGQVALRAQFQFSF